MGSPRTFQVRIDSDLHAAWKDEAYARGIPLAELIRESVSLYCAQVPRPDNRRFTNEELERGREQMAQFFNRLGFKVGES